MVQCMEEVNIATFRQICLLSSMPLAAVSLPEQATRVSRELLIKCHKQINKTRVTLIRCREELTIATFRQICLLSSSTGVFRCKT